jgi:hypothetical protein
MRNKLLRISLAFGLFISLAQASRAQQDPPPTQDPGTDPTKQDAPAPPPQAPLPPGAIDTSQTLPPIRSMNGAGPLPSGRVSDVQFGPIYLQSVDLVQSFDAITDAGQTSTVWQYFTLARAEIVFDHVFKNSHFAVQYQPRLMVLNGNLSADTSNLNATWSTAFHLSPRWNASVSNSLSYFDRQGQFDNLDLMADLTTGSLVQSNFLDGTGHFLTDRTDLNMSYEASPRARFGVTPYFEYYKSTGTQAVGQSEGYGLNATYTYLLSPASSVMVQYQVEDTHFAMSLPTTVYQTVSATYARQLTQTWRFAAGGGLSTSSSSSVGSTTPGARSTQFTENGLFSLIKTFSNSTLAFNYYRGQGLGLQITNGFAERYDLSYIRHFTRRLDMDLGVGYYREFLSATNTSGLYASGGLAYWLETKWSIDGRYTYKKQENGGLNFTTGKLQYISVGISYQPSRTPGT